MEWSYGITTVSERFGTTLPGRLRSLAAAGFEEPRLFVDGVCPPDSEMQDLYWISQRIPRIGLAANWCLSMAELYLRQPNADRFALFQDDIVAVKNIRQYLESVPFPDHAYLNLFTFLDNDRLIPNRPIGWSEAAELRTPSSQVFHGKRQQAGRGAIALIFDRPGLITLFGHPHFLTRPQSGQSSATKIDGGIVESMNRADSREYIHKPSLVAHIGRESTKEGVHWKANARTFPGEEFDALSLLSRA
jgi:hypothetical protein